MFLLCFICLCLLYCFVCLCLFVRRFFDLLRRVGAVWSLRTIRECCCLLLAMPPKRRSAAKKQATHKDSIKLAIEYRKNVQDRKHTHCRVPRSGKSIPPGCGGPTKLARAPKGSKATTIFDCARVILDEMKCAVFLIQPC